MFRPNLHNTFKRTILPTNRKGRDFVVGDLHGCIKPLFQLLRAVEFKPKVDRLFSVGDLIDRGPASSRCLRLVNRRWFRPVLGNHDIAFVLFNFWPGYVKYADYYSAMPYCGGEWYTTRPHGDFLALCKKLDRLPHIITVGREKPEFHVVHASLHPPCGRKPSTFSDTDIEVFSQQPYGECRVQFLTSDRGHWKLQLPSRAEGLALTFCGHTPVKYPAWVLSHLNLDTGAGYSDDLAEVRLTMACPAMRKLWSVPVNTPGRVTSRNFPSFEGVGAIFLGT